MAVSKNKEKERWVSSKYNIGYCQQINGIIYTRISDNRKTTKLVWNEKNKREAIRILEERIKYYLHPELLKQETQELGITTLFSAISDFQSIRYKDFTNNVIGVFQRAFNYYFAEDMPLNYESILQHVIKKNNESDLKVSTRRKYLMQLNRFFEFCIERNYLDKNPLLIIGKPSNPRKEEFLIYEDKEIEAIIKFFREKSLNEYACLFKFLSLSGMRISEALNLKWEDVSDKEIKIYGKGGAIRHFPLQTAENRILFPEIIDTLNELRLINKNVERVFHWNDPAKPRHHLKIAFQKLGIAKIINGQARTIHTFRPTAEYWWENVLMLPFDVICDLAGHSMAVRQAHYRKQRKFKELSNVIGAHIKE